MQVSFLFGCVVSRELSYDRCLSSLSRVGRVNAGPGVVRGVTPSPFRFRGHLAAGLVVAVVAGGLVLAGPTSSARADDSPITLSPDGTVTSNGVIEQTAGVCQGYTIPPGVTAIEVFASGGDGNPGVSQEGHGGGAGGLGDIVYVDQVPVTPGERIYTGAVRGGAPLDAGGSEISPPARPRR